MVTRLRTGVPTSDTIGSSTQVSVAAALREVHNYADLFGSVWTGLDDAPQIGDHDAAQLFLHLVKMFLQLFQGAAGQVRFFFAEGPNSSSFQGGEKPLLLPQTSSVDLSLRNLDRVFCCETHKVSLARENQIIFRRNQI